MSMKTLEAEILKELKLITKNSRLRQKDILAWSTGNVELGADEKHYYLPSVGVNVVIAGKIK